MKTIALVSAFPPGTYSLNEYGYHLAINFAKNADVKKVIVLAEMLDAPLDELDLGPKIEVRRIWSFNKTFTFAKIVKELRSIKPDLALYNLQTATFGDKEIPAALGLFSPLFSRVLGIKSGILAHNMISGVNLEDTVLKGQPIRQAIVRFGGAVVSWAMMKASYVTVTLQSYYDEYTKTYPKADLTLVPHGTFDTDERELTPLGKRGKVIVTMGKFGTYKRLETLIEAMEILRKDKAYHDVKLIIGGTDHPNFKGYMESVEQQNLDKDYIDFHGYVAEDDIADFFSQARLSVFDYSSTTGSSGVLHQTASYGAVPVFPAIGDFVDVCQSEGLRGINYAPNDARDMAHAIKTGLDDLALCEEIGEGNRAASEEIPMSKIIEFHLSK